MLLLFLFSAFPPLATRSSRAATLAAFTASTRRFLLGFQTGSRWVKTAPPVAPVLTAGSASCADCCLVVCAVASLPQATTPKLTFQSQCYHPLSPHHLSLVTVVSQPHAAALASYPCIVHSSPSPTFITVCIIWHRPLFYYHYEGAIGFPLQ